MTDIDEVIEDGGTLPVVDPLTRMLEMQLHLQTTSYGQAPPSLIEGERMAYIRDMHVALIKELGEALDEVGWKPWATSNHMNYEAFLSELVDAWHFFMNFMLVALGPDSPWKTPAEIVPVFISKYMGKHELNAQRQLDGYDGRAGKCPRCMRAYDDEFVECMGEVDDQPAWCQTYGFLD